MISASDDCPIASIGSSNRPSTKITILLFMPWIMLKKSGLNLAHRVISLPCGILSLSGNNGHRPSGTQSSSIYEYTLATPMDEAKGKLGASQNPSIRRSGRGRIRAGSRHHDDTMMRDENRIKK